jgi:hypothetical protein
MRRPPQLLAAVRRWAAGGRWRGQQAWRESGLGAPAGIEALNQKITHPEQQVADLGLQLGERDGELAAARAANRELRAQLNVARHY